MRSVDNSKEANDAMENNPNAIFFQTHDAGQLELQGYPCVITTADPTYLKNFVAFSFQKNSPYRKLFSYFLLAMKQSGQVERLYKMHETRIMTMKHEHKKCLKQPSSFFQSCLPNEPNCVPAITIQTVITALLIVTVGVLLGVMILLIEKLDYAGYLEFCSILKNNITKGHVLRDRGTLIILSIALLISFIIVLALLGYYVYGLNHDTQVPHNAMHFLQADGNG